MVADPESPPSFPHDGLVGFAGPYQSALGSPSWFQELCDAGSVTACRFGLAYKTDNTGVQYFGYVDTDRFDGSLSVAPVVPDTEWGSWTDIALDGKVIEKNAMMVTDSGTTIIFGSVILKSFDSRSSRFTKPFSGTDLLAHINRPTASVQKLFDAAGIQSVADPNAGTLTGYFSCSKPPTVGLGLPSADNATEAAASGSTTISHKSTIFNILPSQLISNQDGDNCTSSIVGTDDFPFWLVGQGTCFPLLFIIP